MGDPLMPEAPSPRADGPITEEEVLDWSARFDAALNEDQELLSFGGERAKEWRAVLFDRSVIDALDRSVDLLLKKFFREEFSDLLFGDARLCGRGFAPSTESRSGKLMRRWRLLGVVPPAWGGARRPHMPEPRYALLAPFHVPILDLPARQSSDGRAALEMLLNAPSRCGPRPPAHIEEHEVQSWAENIRAELHAAIADRGWRPPNLRLSREQWFYSMEQSIELMFDVAFRKDLTEVLYGKTDFHDYGYGLEDAECRRLLRVRWGVTEVTYPVWMSDLDRYILLTRLSVPWLPWAPRCKGQRKYFNRRLQLIHRDELNYHPHYLLICTECGSPQGAFVPLNEIEDAGPEPRVQVARILADRIRPSWHSSRHLKRLAERFSEEILGFGASHHSLPKLGSFLRGPESGPIAEILDWVMGFYHHPESPNWHWLGKLMGEREHRAMREVLLLAGLLGRLQCQVCREIGSLRYYPTFAYPIGADLDASAQGEEVKRLAKVLRSGKDRVASNKLFARLLAFPDEIPRQRLALIWKRAELRHEDAVREGEKRAPNLWLIAMWVAESLKGWPAFCERLGFGDPWGSYPVHSDVHQQHDQLVELGRKLTAMREGGLDLSLLVLEAKRLLDAPEFRQIAGVVVEHYRQDKLDDDLSQFRFRMRDR